MASQGQSPPITLPTVEEKEALVGTHGSPSASNPYVTDSDPRNSDARQPTPHAATHAPGGSDPLIASQVPGFTDTVPADEALLVGQLVYYTATGAAVAKSDDLTRMPARGVVIALSSTEAGEFCTIQLFGKLPVEYENPGVGVAFVGSDGFPTTDITSLRYIQPAGSWAPGGAFVLGLGTPIIRAS